MNELLMLSRWTFGPMPDCPKCGGRPMLMGHAGCWWFRCDVAGCDFDPVDTSTQAQAVEKWKADVAAYDGENGRQGCLPFSDPPMADQAT
jgi:hypothetical protein